MERLWHRRGVNWRARSLAVNLEVLGRGRVGKVMVGESTVRHCKQLKSYEIRSLVK